MFSAFGTDTGDDLVRLAASRSRYSIDLPRRPGKEAAQSGFLTLRQTHDNQYLKSDLPANSASGPLSLD